MSIQSEQGCRHLPEVDVRKQPNTNGCEECLKMGQDWVHLRVCLTCGHVGCCDSSKGKHATKHYHRSKHPIARSLERGEDWAWCYVDETLFEDVSKTSATR
jgi:uncharacterized UBP type Zn finger protein